MLNKQNTKALVPSRNKQHRSEYTQLQNMSVMNTLRAKVISMNTSLWLVDCLPRRCWLHSCHLLWEMRSANLLGLKDVTPRRQVSNPADPLATACSVCWPLNPQIIYILNHRCFDSLEYIRWPEVNCCEYRRQTSCIVALLRPLVGDHNNWWQSYAKNGTRIRVIIAGDLHYMVRALMHYPCYKAFNVVQ